MSPEDPILWTSLPVPVFLLDAEDRISQANPAAETFLNTSARALEGAPVWDTVMIDAPLEEAFARVRDGQAPLFVNDVLVGGGNRPPQHCNIQIAPVSGDETSVLLLISPRELGRRMAHSEHAKTAAKSAIGMAEMLAHEIKNPLAGITGAAQLLSMSLEAEDREMTDLIVDETRRILKLLEQVEQFGNVSKPNLKSLNIHDVLDKARKSALLGFAANCTIAEAYDPSLPHTFADADQLLQVFQNLLKNAAEAGATALTVRTYYEPSLRLRRKDGPNRAVPLQIEVIDDGPGLPDEIAGDIFEPFVSGRENGTGLGLALVSKIISDHDGWIGVESVPGRTVFRISLPVAPNEPEES